jgi:hypothetical protein
VIVTTHDAEDDPKQTETGKDKPRQVKPGRRPAALRQSGDGRWQQRKSDRHVQPEDPLPRRAFDDSAADQRADSDRETADRAPGAEASPRLSSDTAADSKVRVSGIKTAPPTPCTARAAISQPIPGASAAAAEPAVNKPSPAMNMRRRPYRSPRAAPVSSSTANVSV